MKAFPIALLLALPFAPLPAIAQEEGTGLMQRGLRQFMDGLGQEMEPALRGLQGLAQDSAPVLRRLQDSLGNVVQDLDAYAAPEFLPNGDILIRRKVPLEPDEPDVTVPAPEGGVDL